MPDEKKVWSDEIMVSRGVICGVDKKWCGTVLCFSTLVAS